MSVILGINAFHAGSSACLVIDGIPIHSVVKFNDSKSTIVIPHGVSKDYYNDSVIYRKIENNEPIKLLSVSDIEFYKNQETVLKAMRIIINQYSAVLDLVGNAYPPALKSL